MVLVAREVSLLQPLAEEPDKVQAAPVRQMVPRLVHALPQAVRRSCTLWLLPRDPVALAYADRPIFKEQPPTAGAAPSQDGREAESISLRN